MLTLRGDHLYFLCLRIKHSCGWRHYEAVILVCILCTIVWYFYTSKPYLIYVRCLWGRRWKMIQRTVSAGFTHEVDYTVFYSISIVIVSIYYEPFLWYWCLNEQTMNHMFIPKTFLFLTFYALFTKVILRWKSPDKQWSLFSSFCDNAFSLCLLSQEVIFL